MINTTTYTKEISEKLYNEMFKTTDTFKYFTVLQSKSLSGAKVEIIPIPKLTVEQPIIFKDITLSTREIVYENRTKYFNDIEKELPFILRQFGGDVDKLLYEFLFEEFNKDSNIEIINMKDGIESYNFEKNGHYITYLLEKLYKKGNEIFIPMNYFNSIDHLFASIKSEEDCYIELLKDLTVSDEGCLYYKDSPVHFCYFERKCFSTPKDNIYIGLNIKDDIRLINLDGLYNSKMKRNKFLLRGIYSIGINYLYGSSIKLINIE